MDQSNIGLRGSFRTFLDLSHIALTLTWRVAQPSNGKPHSGCPILRGFLRRGGWQTDRTMGFVFHAACSRNEIFPQPSFIRIGTRSGPDSSRK